MRGRLIRRHCALRRRGMEPGLCRFKEYLACKSFQLSNLLLVHWLLYLHLTLFPLWVQWAFGIRIRSSANPRPAIFNIAGPANVVFPGSEHTIASHSIISAHTPGSLRPEVELGIDIRIDRSVVFRTLDCGESPR